MDNEIRARLGSVLIALGTILTFGVLGYVVVEGWPLFDALWMTVITLATIGYGEVHPLSTGGRVFTIILSLAGFGVVAYGFSALTAFIVEGDLKDIMRRKKMESRIRALNDHYIICGLSNTGTSILEELFKIDAPFVVVENDPERAAKARNKGYLVVEGDAMNDEVLQRAGIGNARGLFCTLNTDRDNVFVGLTARGLNPKIRIVSEVHDERCHNKLLRSGANAVVSSPHIGGLRMASIMVRPSAVSFLDSMIRDPNVAYRFEELPIKEGDSSIGRPIKEIRLADQRSPMILAVHESDSDEYSVNPDPERRLKAGESLVVMGSAEQVRDLRKILH